MGVFSGRFSAVLVAAAMLVSWRWRSASAAVEAEETSGERPMPPPAFQKSGRQSPSSSVLRADLEAMRALSRVK